MQVKRFSFHFNRLCNQWIRYYYKHGDKGIRYEQGAIRNAVRNAWNSRHNYVMHLYRRHDQIWIQQNKWPLKQEQWWMIKNRNNKSGSMLCNFLWHCFSFHAVEWSSESPSTALICPEFEPCPHRFYCAGWVRFFINCPHFLQICCFFFIPCLQKNGQCTQFKVKGR